MKLKHGLWIQLPLSMIFLATLILYIVWRQTLINDAYQKIKAVPVLIYSYDLNQLNDLQIFLKKDPSVSLVKIETADSLKDLLINNYNISSNELVQQSRIPNLLTVYFSCDKKIEILNLISQIRQQYSNILIDYPKDVYQQLFTEVKQLKEMTLYGLILLSVLILFVFILLRLIFEISSKEYWRIYINAGGSPSKKHILFWLYSLTLWFFPLVIAFASIILWANSKNIHYNFYDAFLTIPIFLSPCSAFITLIFSGRKS